MGRFDWRTGAVVVVVAVSVLVGMVALAQGNGSNNPPPPAPSKPTRAQLEFAVWGSGEEIAAYQAVVDAWNASSQDTKVTMTSWPDASSMLADLRSGKTEPDLYLLPRSELATTMEEGDNIGLLDLINEREIPIGDDFARAAVQAFSHDDDLQCMPYTASPMVIYYNTDLVDFEAMDAEGLPTPREDHASWKMAELRAAVEYASRPRRGTRGIYIEPSLRGLAPFIYSGGGQVFDDPAEPTSLALGEDGSADALQETLELLRDPRLTLSAKQLSRRTPLQWFERGKLAMIAGFRSLTPQLREAGVSFDVLPMPSLGSSRTVADLTGICIAPGRPGRTGAAANFLSYLVDDEAIGRIAETGYLQPAKLTVALSEAFMQPEQQPEHGTVFTQSLRNMVLQPLLVPEAELEALVAPDLVDLLTTPYFEDLREDLRAIDEKSRTLLDPDYEPEESDGESDDPSGASPSGPSGSPSVPDVEPSSTVTDDRKRD